MALSTEREKAMSSEAAAGRRQMPRAVLWLAAAVIVLVPLRAAAERRDDRFLVGAIYGLTGILADFSGEFKNGARMFLDFQEASGKAEIAIEFEDSRWDPKTAVSAYRKLVSLNGVKAVHVMGSGTSLAIKPLAEQDGIILFTAGAHRDLLSGARLVIRHANLADRDAKVLAESVARHVPAPRRIAELYIENEWGEEYHRHLGRFLRELLPSAELLAEPHLPDEADFRPQLLRLTRAAPQAFVVNSAGAPAALIIKELVRTDFTGAIFVNNGLALSASAERLLREAGIKGFYQQVYPAVDPRFRAEYTARYHKEPGYFAMAAHLDCELLQRAAAEAGRDPRKMAAFIRRLGVFKGRFETVRISPDGDIPIETSVKAFE